MVGKFETKRFSVIMLFFILIMSLVIVNCSVAEHTFAEELMVEVEKSDNVSESKEIDKEAGCQHEHVILQNNLPASCTEKGYSGDEFCNDCQTVIKQGEEILYTEHLYVNGICDQCGWPVPGVYVDNQLMLTWEQLVGNSYITLNGNSITNVIKTLTGTLVVEDGIDVESEAFYESALDAVYMPRTYTNIKRTAFYGANIASIVFFGKVESIGDCAFQYSGLKEIVIPESVTSIPDGCFADCKLLEKVDIHNAVETLGKGAFANCVNLKSIDLPNSIKTIGNRCFSDTGLESVTLPESVIEVGESCFYNCNALTTVDMSQCSVETLASAIFASCDCLQNVILPKNLIVMDSPFDESNKLEYLVLPDTVKQVRLGSNHRYPIESLKWVVWPYSLIDASGFDSASNLETVYYTGNEYQWELITGKDYIRAFDSNKDIFENVQIKYNATEEDWITRLTDKKTDKNTEDEKPVLKSEPEFINIDDMVLRGYADVSYNPEVYWDLLSNKEAVLAGIYPVNEESAEKYSEVVIPGQIGDYPVTGIEAHSFVSVFSYLKKVTLPDNIRIIEHNPFYYCLELAEINVPINSPYIETVDGVLFSKKEKRLICYPRAFTEERYSIPEGTVYIESHAFAFCKHLENIIIPDTVTWIGIDTFQGCSSLKSINIPNSVTYIGQWAFSECENLTIRVSRNSYAEDYCKQFNLKYIYEE